MSSYNWWRFCFFNSIGSHSVTLRGIRNKFAHAKERLNLDSEPISALLKKLSTTKHGRTPKDTVSLAIQDISRHLVHAVHERTKDDERKKDEFLIDD
jgi:hypothetical protein